MIRILIVEDRPGVGQGLRMLLEAEADLSVVGEAVDGTAALALIAALGPDVVLMDVEQRRMDGIATMTALHQAFPRTPIIMLSIDDDACARAIGYGAGATAFVSKLMPAAALVAGIRQVAYRLSDASTASAPGFRS
jgi:DNA-binding NarL/FixJ family response regulator